MHLILYVILSTPNVYAQEPTPAAALSAIGITAPNVIADWEEYVAEQRARAFNKPDFVYEGRRWSYELGLMKIPSPAGEHADRMMYLKHLAVRIKTSPRGRDESAYRLAVAHLSEAVLYFIAALQTPTAMKLGGSEGLDRRQVAQVMDAVLAGHLDSDPAESRLVWADVRATLASAAFRTSLRRKAHRAARRDKVQRFFGLARTYVFTLGLGHVLTLFYRDSFAPHSRVISILDEWTGTDCPGWLTLPTSAPTADESAA